MMNNTPTVTWYAKLGGRKWLICAFVVLSVTGMRAFMPARISESGYITLVTLIVAAFVTGNVTQKATAKPQATPAASAGE